MAQIRFKTVAMVAYVTLLVPVVLFFLGWLRPYIGIPASLILVAGFVWLWRGDYRRDNRSVQIPVKHLVAIGICIAVWVVLTGAVGFFRYKLDIPWRTACLNDLITYSWPIVYPETGNGFSYYVTFWLPVACVGKLLGMRAALVALWLYLTHFVMVTYLLLVLLLKLERPAHLWISAFALLFFGGLVAIGQGVFALFGITPASGYIGDFQKFADDVTAANGLYFNFRSNFGVLENVYNQTAIWPCVLLVLHSRRPRSFLFLGLVLLAFSPWGIMGIIPVMVGVALPGLVAACRSHKVGRFLLDIVSPANIAALVTCLPIYYLFLFKAGADNVGSAAEGVCLVDFSAFTPVIVAVLVLFYVVEFGVYAGLLVQRFRRSALFWFVIATLVLVPFVRIGSSGYDFVLNVSIPAFFTLMVLVVSALCQASLPAALVDVAAGECEKSSWLHPAQEPSQHRVAAITCGKGVRIALAVSLAIAALSPAAVMASELRTAVSTKTVLWDGEIGTFAHSQLSEETSLVAGAADREGLFYQLIAR